MYVILLILIFFFSVLVLVLLPGMKQHGILQKYFSTGVQAIANLMKSSVAAVQGGKKSEGDSNKKKD